MHRFFRHTALPQTTTSWLHKATTDGGAENAGLENAGVTKMQGWKTRHQTAGVENAGLENAGV